MTVVLAADTTTSINSLAICRDGRVLVETVAECGRLHAERLLPTVDWILAEAGLSLHHIDLFAISAGPGSFTGLRIGVAAWKGLALGEDKPLAAVPTLDAMARSVAGAAETVCPLLDARMAEVYGAIYRYEGTRREKLIPDRVCSIGNILDALPGGPVRFLGDGADSYYKEIVERLPGALFAPAFTVLPRAALVAGEALDLAASGAPLDAALAEPVYLRGSQAEMNLARSREQAARS